MSPTPTRVFSGDRFRALRKERGITGTVIARHTGIPESTLSTWAKGHNTPTLEKLILVADVLGCSLDDFLAVSEEVASDGSHA
jgi:transcriptional regulator with XRE-family HTH domain